MQVDRRPRKTARRRHGESKTRLYVIWCNIKQRCGNPNCPAYKTYGGAGVKMCKAWKEDFFCFKSWALSAGYEDHLTIDRKNVKRGYSPSNCRWITREENISRGSKRHAKHRTGGHTTRALKKRATARILKGKMLRIRKGREVFTGLQNACAKHISLQSGVTEGYARTGISRIINNKNPTKRVGGYTVEVL